MSKKIRANITMSEETQEKGLELSKLLLGKKNLSGYVSYLINKEYQQIKK